MKKEIILIIAALTSLAPAQEPTPYPIRDLPAPTLQNVYQAILAADQAQTEKNTPKERWGKIKLSNRLADGLWLAELWRESGVPGEAASALSAITGRTATFIEPELVRRIALDLGPGDDTRADGDTLSGTITDTGKVHRYITVTGTEASIRVWSLHGPAKQAASFTFEQFLTQARAGKEWVIPMGTRTLRCDICGGFGRVTPKNTRTREPDGKTNCPACNGIGKAAIPALWVIRW